MTESNPLLSFVQVKSADQQSSEKKTESDEEEESRPPMDLFKAIFASSSDEKSSSEEESDNEEDEEDAKEEGKVVSQPVNLFNITSSSSSAVPSNQPTGALTDLLLPHL